MRILMCCADWGVPVGGGAGSSVHLRAMAGALARLGHQVRLVVSNAGGAFQPGVPVETVGYRRLWPTLSAMVETIRGSRTTAPSRPAPPDAGPPSPDAPPLTDAPVPMGSRALSWKTRFYYETLPDFADRLEEYCLHPLQVEKALNRSIDAFVPDAVYERYALGQTGAARTVARAGGNGPLHFLEVNASLVLERSAQGSLSGPWLRLAAQREVRLWRGVDRVFCVSEPLRRMVETAGADPARVLVAPNGVDVERFTPDRPKGALRRLLGVDSQTVLIGWLGALSPGRGAQEFLDIMAMTLPVVDDAMGVLIGGGPLEQACRRQAHDLGLDGRVAFAGMAPHETVPDLLVDLDIAVSCYPAQGENYFSPMKVAEYLASGLAVVAVRAGGADDMITDGVSGLVVEPADRHGWSLALTALCRDADLRARLGAQARRRALAGPTWLGNARRVEQEILACRRERDRGGRP